MKRNGSWEYCIWSTPKFHWPTPPTPKIRPRPFLFDPRQAHATHAKIWPTSPMNLRYHAPTLSTSPTLFSRFVSYNDHICWNSFRWRNISKLCKMFFCNCLLFKWSKVCSVVITQDEWHAMIAKALKKLKIYISWALYLAVNLMNSKEPCHTFGSMPYK